MVAITVVVSLASLALGAAIPPPLRHYHENNDSINPSCTRSHHSSAAIGSDIALVASSFSKQIAEPDEGRPTSHILPRGTSITAIVTATFTTEPTATITHPPSFYPYHWDDSGDQGAWSYGGKEQRRGIDVQNIGSSADGMVDAFEDSNHLDKRDIGPYFAWKAENWITSKKLKSKISKNRKKKPNIRSDLDNNSSDLSQSLVELGDNLPESHAGETYHSSESQVTSDAKLIYKPLEEKDALESRDDHPGHCNDNWFCDEAWDFDHLKHWPYEYEEVFGDEDVVGVPSEKEEEEQDDAVWERRLDSIG